MESLKKEKEKVRIKERKERRKERKEELNATAADAWDIGLSSARLTFDPCRRGRELSAPKQDPRARVLRSANQDQRLITTIKVARAKERTKEIDRNGMSSKAAACDAEGGVIKLWTAELS